MSVVCLLDLIWRLAAQSTVCVVCLLDLIWRLAAQSTVSVVFSWCCPIIGLDKGGYPVNSFLISPQKHMLLVLIRSTSVRCF